MLRFFFTRDNLPLISTQEAEPFQLLSAAEFKNGIIPFSHMYITSESYLKQIQYSLKDNNEASIIQVSEKQSDIIFNQSNFPPNLTEYKINSFDEYKTLLGKKHEAHIVIVNGIGGDYCDNYIGLAIIQRISKLLAPFKVHFHLMQSLELRFKSIYQDNAGVTSANITHQNNIMSIEQFMSMDAYIDLSSIVNYEEYGHLSRSHFFLTAFSLENLIADRNIQPYLTNNSEVSTNLRELIEKRFSEQRPLILVHLISSSKIKTCPAGFTHSLIAELINQGFNVISANPLEYSSHAFCDCSDLVDSLSKLTNIIDACDCIVSTGSLSMNIAASIGKPIILLPITKSNILTAKQLPEVLIWSTQENKDLYIDIVEKETVQQKLVAQQIWSNINTTKLAIAAKDYLKQFNHIGLRAKSKTISKRLAVVIPFCQDGEDYEKYLCDCLDALIKVDGFNALWLEVIDSRFEHVSLTHAYNTGINKAIKNDCEFIWILDPKQIPNPNYFSKALKRFESDPNIAIVTGMQIDNDNQNRIVWSGSLLSFPKQQFKAGFITNAKLNKPSFEQWVPFESAIIRTKAAIDVGPLDETLQQQFSDIDYCFRLTQNGWSTVYEPKAKSYKVNLSITLIPQQKEILVNDLKYFFKKWGHITGCNNFQNLHTAIVKYVQKKALRHKKRKQLGDNINSTGAE